VAPLLMIRFPIQRIRGSIGEATCRSRHWRPGAMPHRPGWMYRSRTLRLDRAGL